MANVCDCKSLNDGSIPSSAFIRKLHYCFFNLLYYLTYLCAFLKSSSPFFNSNWLYKSLILKEGMSCFPMRLQKAHRKTTHPFFWLVKIWDL